MSPIGDGILGDGILGDGGGTDPAIGKTSPLPMFRPAE